MKVIASLAEKGGVGKTTFAAIVAVAAAKAGKRVLVLVCDIQSGAAGILAPEAAKVGGSERFLLGESPQPISGRLGVHVLGGGPGLDGNPVRDLRHDELRFALAKVAKDFDFVVIDVAPVLRHIHRMALDAADIALVVTDQSREGLLGVNRVLNEIKVAKDRGAHAPAKTIVVSNRVFARSLHDQETISAINEIASRHGATCVAVPTTTAIPSAMDGRKPEACLKGNPASEVIANLVAKCGIK